MAHVSLNHEIACDQSTFWTHFFDKRFTEQLRQESAEYQEFSILEIQETATETRRQVQAQPKLNLPPPVIKILGSNYRYTEEGVFNKATQIWSWQRTSTVQADKIRMVGTLRIEPLDGGKVRCIEEIAVEVKILGVGGLIETSFEEQLRAEANTFAAFYNAQQPGQAGGQSAALSVAVPYVDNEVHMAPTAVRPAPDRDIITEVKQIVKEQLHIDWKEINLDANLIDDLDADSLGLVELTLNLEEAFGIDIPDEDTEKIRTVQDIVDYINRNMR